MVRALVEMSVEDAIELTGRNPAEAPRALVIEGVERDLERTPDLAGSALAGLARAMAFEIEHPHNSATSKSMCAGQLRDTLDRMRELAPPKEEADEFDDLVSRRAARLAGGAATAH